jgi:hypothetical protein
MAVMLNSRILHLVAAFVATSLLLAPGCQKAEQIQSYTVPKEPKIERAATAAPAAKPGEPTDRMLAAILPSGGQAWFFKAVGPIAEIDKHEKEINEFFTTLTLAPDGRANWKLPADWKEQPGDNQIVFATLVLPGDSHVKFTVSSASWPGTEESMLANVNRWRGQLQLPPIGAKQLPDVSHEAKAGDWAITIVDMRGQFKSGGMTPPFAGGAFGPRATGAPGKNASQPDGLPPGHPPIDAPPAANNGLPAGHPPIDNAPATDASAEVKMPTFTKPEAWKSITPTQPMRLAEFTVGDGATSPHVTIFRFPADAPMIADPRSNIDRWRGEVGLKPLDKEGLAAATQPIEIDGLKATYAPIIPDTSKPAESQLNEATLGGIVKVGDQIWFVKMRGERDLVKKHEDEFKAFLKSIKFPHEK